MIIQTRFFSSSTLSGLELNINYFLEHDKTIDKVIDIAYKQMVNGKNDIYTAMVMYQVKEKENGN